MNFDRNISAPRLVFAVGLVLGLILAIYVGAAVGNQEMSRVWMILLGAGGIATLLWLGQNYWLLIPLSLSAKVAAIPMGGRTLEFPEVAIAACTLIFIVRVATRHEKVRLFVPASTPFLLFMAWVLMVFTLHPIGFSMLGSNVGGGRFYVKLGLAFASFIILANRTYTERDMKLVVGLMIFGAFVYAARGIAEFYFLGGPDPEATDVTPDEFYSWHQVLAVPALTLTFMIFARWSPAQIFGLQRPLVFAASIMSLALVLWSGKRMGLAAALLTPLVSAVMYKQFRYVVLAVLLTIAGSTVLISGQGNWFNLPLVVQRSLSWLPADWDRELESVRGGSDEFRYELRRIASERVKAAPLVGQGYAVNIGEILSNMALQRDVGGLDIVTAGHAASRNWHNVWLGYAADFGIPLSVFQAMIFISVLVLSSRIFSNYSNRSLLGVFALYVFIYTFRDVIASHTSGHTATDAFDRWWMYGIIVGIYLQMRAEQLASKPAARPREKFAPAVPQPAGAVS